MLKKFTDGLVFGAGFAAAFVIIWNIGMAFVLPKTIEALNNPHPKIPKFDHPKQAESITPHYSTESATKKDFSFFKSRGEAMQIPHGGGILAMTPLSTPATSKKPYTYQLWLTSSELWQIKTLENSTEIERIDRPADANLDYLNKLMEEKLGPLIGRSSMTVSSTEIEQIKAGGSWRNDGLNGKLTLSKEGVVFVYPNNY